MFYGMDPGAEHGIKLRHLLIVQDIGKGQAAIRGL